MSATSLSPPRCAEPNSVPRPTDPTPMAAFPESFFAQPARLRSEPSNSGSQ